MTATRTETFAARLAARDIELSPAEREVATYFAAQREEVLVASAVDLAHKIGTSDATVIRTAKALGFTGLDDLRRQLAQELRASMSPAVRLTRTLGSVNDERVSPFELAIDTHRQAIDRLRSDISPALFEAAVERITAAARVFVFGLGPSSAIATYFVIQLRRFGIEADGLTHSGLLLADGLHRLRTGDALVILAYSRVYEELDALLRRAKALKIRPILLTDTLGPALRGRADPILSVARGNARGFSTHTATLGLIEALLIGIAAARPAETVSQLKELNDLRASLATSEMSLTVGRARRPRRRGK
jgi:DNA-binding MurR/RpiR family transcriptional regulator